MKRLAAAALLIVAACNGDSGERAASPTTTSAEAPGSTSTSTTTGDLRVGLERVAELERPVNMITEDGVIYVVEQIGRIRAVRDGEVVRDPVLDLSEEVRVGSEQGLLGLAFANDGRHLYVNYTDANGDTRIVEFAFDGEQADPDARRELLRIDQPFANHNGGHIVMDDDDSLWIGMGDGGSAGDPQNNAQNPDSLLGKLLRLDMKQSDPEPEIWALGLRNPWRFFLDTEGDALWVADVGQNAVEEINRVPLDEKGINYGWRPREGTQPFRAGEKPPGAVDPIFEYSHDTGGCSVTGGEVYRGDAIPALRGAYLFGDYCLGQVNALFVDGGDARAVDLGVSVEGLTSFGSDENGELYVLSGADGGMYRVVPD